MYKFTILLGISVILISLVSCSKADKTIRLNASQCDTPGRRVPDGETPTVEDVALDRFCATVIMERSAPRGYVTIFGSARAKEGMVTYDQTRTFAAEWTKKYGKEYPILTGGGPGIMEAGNRGAKEAGGSSLGFSTYFGKGNEPLNPYTTDGYVFASFAQREADMVDGAVAILIAPGGVGTEWEIFETVAKIQTGKKNQVPVVLMGPRLMWQPLFERIEHMKRIKTISPEDSGLLQHAETPEEAIQLIENGMNLKAKAADKADKAA